MARTLIDTSLIKPFSTTFIGLGRNRIINGEMRIDQANGGAAVTIIVPTLVYTLDQFSGVGVAASGVYTIQRSTSTPPTGFTHFMRATCTTADASIAAGDLYMLRNFVEGNNVRDFLFGAASAKTVTLSFWVRSSLTGTYTGSIQNGGGNRTYTYEYTVNVANTWEQKSITFIGDTTGTWLTDTNAGMCINWGLAVGSTYQTTAGVWGAGNLFGTSNQVNFMSSNSSRTWDLTGVQLEIGSLASPFEYRPHATEVLFCQRYYEKSSDLDAAPNTVATLGSFRTLQKAISATASDGGNEMFQVIKRTAPTMSGWHPDAGTANTWTANAVGGNVSVTPSFGRIGVRGFDGAFTGGSGFTAGQACYVLGHWVADARL